MRKHNHALRRFGCFYGNKRGIYYQRLVVGRCEQKLAVLPDKYRPHKRKFIAESAHKPFAVGLCAVRRHRHLCRPAVFKEKYHVPAVIGRRRHCQNRLVLLHGQLCGHIVAQRACLRVVKLAHARFVSAVHIRKKYQLLRVAAFKALPKPVPVLKALRAVHSQRLRRYLFEISLLGQKQSNTVILHMLLNIRRVVLLVIDKLAFALARILLFNALQILDYYFVLLLPVRKHALQLCNFRL